MPKPVTFKTVYTAMKQYKERAAPGAKCDAWADFAEHSRKRLPGNLRVSRRYWLAVADRTAPITAATGAWIDTVDAEDLIRAPAKKKPRRSNQRGLKQQGGE
jgi:hypothetical protein